MMTVEDGAGEACPELAERTPAARGKIDPAAEGDCRAQ